MDQHPKEQRKQPSSKTLEFDKDQPSESAGSPTPARVHMDEVPRFDEGGRTPAPIERTGNDGVRSAELGESASLKKRHDDKRNTEATMPPGEQQPKRNTM